MSISTVFSRTRGKLRFGVLLWSLEGTQPFNLSHVEVEETGGMLLK